MDGGIYSQVNWIKHIFLRLIPILTKIIWIAFLIGYATYMNIQFCVYNRAKYLDQNPKYSCDIMGISVDVQHRRKIE